MNLESRQKIVVAYIGGPCDGSREALRFHPGHEPGWIKRYGCTYHYVSTCPCCGDLNYEPGPEACHFDAQEEDE